MTESEFLDLADLTLKRIETAFDRLNDEDVVDVECKRSGNGTKIIINSQAPLQEMWLAARSGGYHYKRVGDEWRNTRDDSEFFAALGQYASEQGGATVTLV
jgi:CyaY protein